MTIYLTQLSAADEQYSGFFDGKQRLIPDNTELEVTVTGGFFGYKEEGSAVMSAELYLVVSSPGEFLGQSYTWRPKVYDTNAQRAEIALKNLALFDSFMNYPIAKSGQPLSAELIEAEWANRARAVALFRTNEAMLIKEGKTEAPINFIAGFKRAQKPAPQAAPQVTLQQPQQQQVQQPAPQPQPSSDQPDPFIEW